MAKRKSTPKKKVTKTKKAATRAAVKASVRSPVSGPGTELKREINPVNDVLPHHVFNLLDGRQLKNLYDLAEALETMSEDVYSHHANQEKNDFSNWLKHCTNEEELSEEIRNAVNKYHAQAMVLKRIGKRYGIF